jgi:general secretion pathway protein K
MSRRSRTGDQRGFALVAVLLVLAFVAVVGAEFAYSMRLEATAARVYKETLIATHLAEAGVEQAIRELVADFQTVSVGDDRDPDVDAGCPIVFYGRDRVARKRLPHKSVALGGGQFTYCISDEEARLNLNSSAATVDRLNRLLEAIGVEREDRDTIVGSLQDWKDANEEHRLNGAESDDTYLKRPIPYRSRNANLDSVAELIQIKGITAKLLEGEEGRPGLASLVTVRTQGTINLNTAGREVLKAVGFSEAELTEVEQARRLGPYTSVPGRFAQRNLAVSSRTFRIEAEGLIDGQVRARLTAVVQKGRAVGGAGGEGVAVMDWSGVR